jgi:hypothetical protein
MTSSQHTAGAVIDISPDVLTQIFNGELDYRLEAIAKAVKIRRQELQSRKTIGLMKGDHVKIGGSAPSREHGGVVIVKYVNQKTVTVRSDSPAFVGTKWARSVHVRIPLSWIGEVV